jgi:hypothetical protein
MHRRRHRDVRDDFVQERREDAGLSGRPLDFVAVRVLGPFQDGGGDVEVALDNGGNLAPHRCRAGRSERAGIEFGECFAQLNEVRDFAFREGDKGCEGSCRPSMASGRGPRASGAAARGRAVQARFKKVRAAAHDSAAVRAGLGGGELAIGAGNIMPPDGGALHRVATLQVFHGLRRGAFELETLSRATGLPTFQKNLAQDEA